MDIPNVNWLRVYSLFFLVLAAVSIGISEMTSQPLPEHSYEFLGILWIIGFITLVVKEPPLREGGGTATKK